MQGFCEAGKVIMCAEGETCSGSPAVCAAPTTEGSTGDQPPPEGEVPPEGEAPPEGEVPPEGEA